MRRFALITLLAAVIAAAGSTPEAGADPTCMASIGPTWIVKDPVVGWMVGTNSVSATCAPAWRVALSPQYQADDGTWHGGRLVFNHIYYPAVNTYFDAGSTQTQDPTCCVLYWDDGDGTEAFTPLCRNPWRIHAGFWTETPAGPAKFADAYSDPTTVTCPEPQPRS
jgi:hypothetical protein